MELLHLGYPFWKLMSSILRLAFVIFKRDLNPQVRAIVFFDGNAILEYIKLERELKEGKQECELRIT